MAKLALPIALQQLLVSCAQLVDTAMVTPLGNVIVSAVGVSSRWIFLMNPFLFRHILRLGGADITVLGC